MSIWMSRNDEGSLYVHFKYDEHMVMKIREIPGRKWTHDKKVWMIPLEIIRELCLEIVNKTRDPFEVARDIFKVTFEIDYPAGFVCMD